MIERAGFGRMLLAGAVALGLAGGACGRAEAAFTFTMQEVALTVIMHGSGSVNLAGLVLDTTDVDFNSDILARDGLIQVAGVTDIYFTVVGPTSFGSGGSSAPILTNGDPFYIFGQGGALGVPQDYVSGAPLSNMMIFVGTLGSLGITPGTYVWSWGSGADADSVTLQIDAPAPQPVPEPASALLAGAGLLGLAAMRRLRKGPTRT